ncbi:HD family phosphohydrolase [Clostridium sp. MSJ-11]|uniref:HD family phosphohydrolase n=2 Tax=Clostridium mobile TaxID=2841512 RepID=A0ABS6EMH6_9CLOT|nr:HD family phosphohydrolase [Clostridium mobile]MBU5486434.1 HD family phosphohydrolase [Clostridium mobile]
MEQLLLSTGREGIQDLLSCMDNQGFYQAPCSSQHHLSRPSGLAEHSLNVFDYMFATAWGIDFIRHGNTSEAIKFEPNKMSSIIITSLLHDIGKMGIDNTPHYEDNYLKDGSLSKNKPYVINKSLLNVPHEVLSLSIIERYIRLTHEERHAILSHNGAYGALWYQIKGNETPLYMLLHFADMWASRVVEKEEK